MDSSLDLNIYDKDRFKFDDRVYFLIHSVENPTVFLRFFGTIRDRVIKDNNVFYLIEFEKLIENKKIPIFFHDCGFNTVMKNSRFYNTKKINCIDVIGDLKFDDVVRERLSKYLFVVPPFFVSETQNEMETLRDFINESIKEQINHLSDLQTSLI